MPGAKFYLPEDRKARERLLKHRAETMRGVPRLTEYSFVNWVGGGGHIGFSPVSPINGKEAMKQYTMVRDRMRAVRLRLHGCVRHRLARTAPRRRAGVRPARPGGASARPHEVFGLMVREAAEAGYGEYRTHISFMDQIAKTYSWNDNAHDASSSRR